MLPPELAQRLASLLAARKSERAGLSDALLGELKILDNDTLCGLLCFCEGGLEPRTTARTGTKLLLNACKGRSGLSVARLLRNGLPLPTLVQVAHRVNFTDLPPSPELADELLAALMNWIPNPAGSESWRFRESASSVVLGAVRLFGISQRLHGETVELLLQQAFRADDRWLTGRQVVEAGSLMPEWRPQIIQLILAESDSTSSLHSKHNRGCAGFALHPHELVRIAQDWGAHENPMIFAELERLVHETDAAKGYRNAIRQSPLEHLEGLVLSTPMLQLVDENIVLVDGPESAAIFAAATEAATSKREADQDLCVSMDAEWRDPRPLSLLQLAVSVAGAAATVFIIDMLAHPSVTTLDCCRRLLCSNGSVARHEVLTFGPREDRRRLAIAGVLPETGAGNGSCEFGWIDLQLLPWGLGPQPSLQAVCEQELGCRLDKLLQRSNWDRRPLEQEQVCYAALDASILLRLRKRSRTCPKSINLGTTVPEIASASSCDLLGEPGSLSREQERLRWRCFRAARQKNRGLPGPGDERENCDSAREVNADLRFVLPSSLTRLMRKMRGLGLDTTILAESASTRQLAQTAVDEDRVILTRTRKMQVQANAVHRLYFVRAGAAEDQLREIIDVFGVKVDSDCLCGRCVQCNTWDWRLATRDDVRSNPQVNKKTLAAFDEFWVCGGCGKIYWEGGMFEKAIGHFRKFMTDCDAAGALESDSEALGASSKDRPSVDTLGPDSVAIADEAPALPCLGASLRPDELARYREMEAQGLSVLRIRARMVRDGVLTPGRLAASGAAEACAQVGNTPVEGKADVSNPCSRAEVAASDAYRSALAIAAAQVKIAFVRATADGLEPSEAAAQALRKVIASSVPGRGRSVC